VDNVSYSYSQSISFLGQRPWALYANGTAKPLLNGAISFHSGLMSSGTHVSDTVPHYYISGTNKDTKTTAVYTTNLFGNKTLSRFENGSGDGTVTLGSSENRTAYWGYRVENVEHGDLVGNASVIQDVKATLNYGFNYFRPNVLQMSASLANSGAPTFENNKITIVLEGTEEISLEDEFGNAIIEIGEDLYVRDSQGAEKPVGSVWVIDYETNRKQYNLNSGEYSMTLSNTGEAKSASDMLVIYTESGEYKSYETYDNLAMTGSVQISITPDKTEIFADSGGNAARRKNIIVPSDVWDYNKLREYNSYDSLH
jgi:hypothetical protein